MPDTTERSAGLLLSSLMPDDKVCSATRSSSPSGHSSFINSATSSFSAACTTATSMACRIARADWKRFVGSFSSAINATAASAGLSEGITSSGGRGGSLTTAMEIAASVSPWNGRFPVSAR